MDLNSTGRDVSSGLSTNHKVVGGGIDRLSFFLLSKVSGVHANPLLWTPRGLFYCLTDSFIWDRINVHTGFIMTAEVSVKLNVHEVGVILSALQLLETGDELLISKEYGSSTALYSRMEDLFEGLDQSDLTLFVEPYIEPSF